MGLDVQRTGPSRPLRTLSESPADDLAAANDAGAAAVQLPTMPDMVLPLDLLLKSTYILNKKSLNPEI